MLCRKWNTFITESFSLFFPYLFANTHTNTHSRECPCLAGRAYSWEDVGSSLLKQDSFMLRESELWKKEHCNTVTSLCYFFFSMAQPDENIWEHQALFVKPMENVAHEVLYNLDVSWVFSYSPVLRGCGVTHSPELRWLGM